MRRRSETSPAAGSPSRDRRDGLTLIECVVAVGVLATMLAGLFAAMAHAMRADVLAREYAAASRAAFAQLDLLMTQSFSGVVASSERGFHVPFSTGSSGSNTEVNLPPASAGQLSPHPDVAATTTQDESQMAGRFTVVQDPDGNGSDELAEIRVTIRWRGADGRDQQVEAVGRRGL